MDRLYRSGIVNESPYPGEAFLAGLIHDIGRLALQAEYPQVYAQFPHTLQDKEILLETERLIFGQTHAQIGGKTLRAYHLDSFVVDAVQYHTESELRIKTGFELVKIVFIACRLTQSPGEDIEHVSDLGESLFSLTPDQLLAAVKTADEQLVQIVDHFHIPRTEAMENSDTEKTDTSLRIQAVDYSILQGALPCPAAIQEFPQAIRLVHQGLDILFGIKSAICLMVNDQRSSLQAVGYPNCFGWELLSNIVLSLESESSLIAEAFTTSELKISTDGKTDSPLSLADEQIIGILHTRILVCVPMIAHAVTRGVIVFGIRREELPNIHSQQKRLEQFGARSANTLFASAQISTNS